MLMCVAYSLFDVIDGLAPANRTWVLPVFSLRVFTVTDE